MLARPWERRVTYRSNYDYVFFVPDQYVYLDRKIKRNNNLLVNKRRIDKQWSKKKQENLNSDRSTKHYIYNNRFTKHYINKDRSTKHYINNDRSTKLYKNIDQSTKHYIKTTNWATRTQRRHRNKLWFIITFVTHQLVINHHWWPTVT